MSSVHRNTLTNNKVITEGMEIENDEIVRHLFVLCRLCISGDGKYAIVPHTPIHTAIEQIFSVKIKPYDGLSQLLCEACREKLSEIQSLRNTYIVNQQILMSLKTSHHNGQQPLVKTEAVDDDTAELLEPETMKNIPGELEKILDSVVEGQQPLVKTEAVDDETAELLEPETMKNIPGELEKILDSVVETNGQATEMKSEVSDVNQPLTNQTLEQPLTNQPLEQPLTNQPLEQPLTNTLKIGRISKNPDDVDLNTFTPDTDNTHFHYRYYCRMCSSDFVSLNFLNQHLAYHKNLTKLQRRYTPYGCSVKLMRELHSFTNETTDMGQYHPHFYVKRRTNETKHSTDYVDYVDYADVSDYVDYADVSDGHESDVSHSSRTTINCEVEPQSSSMAVDSFELQIRNMNSDNEYCDTTSINVGSILRKTCDLLNNDVEEPKPEIECSPNEEAIIETIWFRMLKYRKSLADRELIQVQQILLQVCLKNIEVNWKEIQNDSGLEVNLDVPKRLFQSNPLHNFIGFSVVPRDHEVHLETVKTIPATLVAANSVQEATNIENGPETVCGSGTGSGGGTNEPMLPIIVSTTSLEHSTAAVDSTSVYIDLEDEKNTLYSNESPISFLKSILQMHDMDLLIMPANSQAVTLCCFKKYVENKGPLIINLSVDNYTFYVEVLAEKTRVDLEKESFITQWHVLNLLNEPKTKNLMRNYAKRSPTCCDNVDKFIKITNSISSKICGDSILMEAPKKFFF